MKIHEMSMEECHRVLAGAQLARLGCARANQPYVVPVYLAFHQKSECFYGFTTPGQKVEWMRENPLVCVEVDEIVSCDQWVSIIVTGRYEELPETPASKESGLRAPERPRPVGEFVPFPSADTRQRQIDDERELAWQVLKSRAMWWEPAQTAWAARDHRASSDPFTSVFYKIRIERITGHKATPDSTSFSCDERNTYEGRWRRLLKATTRIFGGRTSLNS